MDNLIAWLPKNIPATDETTVVHGDYRLDKHGYSTRRSRGLLGGARLGALDLGRSARRFLLSLA